MIGNCLSPSRDSHRVGIFLRKAEGLEEVGPPSTDGLFLESFKGGGEAGFEGFPSFIVDGDPSEGGSEPFLILTIEDQLRAKSPTFGFRLRGEVEPTPNKVVVWVKAIRGVKCSCL